MTVISCKEIHRGRGGAEEKTGLKSHTRIFLVITDSAYDEDMVVLSCPLLPTLNSVYVTSALGAFDQRSFCIRRRADQQDDRHVWYVFCDYEPRDNELRPKRSVRWEKKKKAMTGVRSQIVDANGQPTQVDLAGNKKVFTSLIANSFGEPFDPAPEGEVSYPVITIKRIEPGGISFPKLMYFKDAINAYQWGPVPPYCAKVMSMNSEEEYRTTNSIEKLLWWCTYEIGLDPDTWLIWKLDAGYHYYTETGHAEGAGVRKSFMDEDGNPRQGLLSNEPNAAHPAGTQKGIKLVDLTKPEFLPFHFYPERDLSGLNLPTDLNAILPPATP